MITPPRRRFSGAPLEPAFEIRRGGRSLRTFAAAVLTSALLAGCGSTSVLKDGEPLAATALKTTALARKGDESDARLAPRLSVMLAAGPQLNANEERKPLSLVVRIYQLRAVQSFQALTYAQAMSPQLTEETLGTDLIAVKEVVLLPGKRYEFKPRLPGDAQAIGVVGLFHTPASGRWKLAFDAPASLKDGITVGAHVCTLTAGHGALIEATRPEEGHAPASLRCGS